MSSISLRLTQESLLSNRESRLRRKKLLVSHVRQLKRLLSLMLSPQAVMRHLKTQTVQATEIKMKTTSECRKLSLQ